MDAGCAQPEHQRRRHDGFDEPARAELFDCRIEPEQHAKSKSKTQRAKPNMIMNRRMKWMSQRRGCSMSSGSFAIVISGRSVNKLMSEICFGSSGKNGRSSDAPA